MPSLRSIVPCPASRTKLPDCGHHAADLLARLSSFRSWLRWWSGPLICNEIFPPSATSIRPLERTDDEGGTTDSRAAHRHLARASGGGEVCRSVPKARDVAADKEPRGPACSSLTRSSYPCWLSSPSPSPFGRVWQTRQAVGRLQIRCLPRSARQPLRVAYPLGRTLVTTRGNFQIRFSHSMRRIFQSADRCCT